MSAIVSHMEDLKLDRAGRDITPSPTASPTRTGDRTSAISAINDIMVDLAAHDKLCVERCHSATANFKKSIAKIQAAIVECIEEDSTGVVANSKIKTLQRKQDKLGEAWEQQVTECTSANLEEREKCNERVKFVARVAQGAGIDVRSAVKEAKEKLGDQAWWEEVNAILEQASE
jgi:hypothetical protein